MIQEICVTFLKVTAFYFLAVNFIYIGLAVLSWLKIKRLNEHSQELASVPLPPVSFIVPAYNEQDLIVETIQTYLSLEMMKEIIVIDDGSKDSTMRLLRIMFQLRKSDKDSSYRSITHPDLVVLSAPHMGKAHALNFGVLHSQYEIICTMDADTVPVARGVRACLESFAHNPRLMAAGGVIQVLGSQILKNNTPAPSPRTSWLTSFQRIEYLRTFVCERLGWSYLRSTLLISGAFCMVKKTALSKVGGFNRGSITEDFDLIVRLRKEFRGENHQFDILPVTACYTQAPKTMKHLMRQRIRWQMGLIQTLKENLSLLFNPKQGAIGFVAVPYFWLVEAISPVIELMAMLIIPYAIYEGWVSLELFLTYLAVALSLNMIITFVGMSLDNKHVSGNKAWSIVSALFEGIVMHFGYKQINSWWRLLAIIKCIGKDRGWGEKPRQEIIHQGI